jgi:hypothetical protein
MALFINFAIFEFGLFTWLVVTPPPVSAMLAVRLRSNIAKFMKRAKKGESSEGS